MGEAALERATAAVDDRARPLVENTRSGRLNAWVRAAGLLSSALILALFAFGVVMMGTMLAPLAVVAGVLALPLLPLVLDLFPRQWWVPHFLAIAIVAVVVSLMALLGLDVLWASAGGPRPAPEIGLVMAGIVLAAVSYAYLRWVGKEPPRRHKAWAVYAAVAGFVLGAITRQDVLTLGLIAVAAATGFAALIYLRRAAGPDIKHPLWWALLFVGVAVVLAPLLVEAIQGKHTNVLLLIAGGVIATIAGFNGLWLHDQTARRRLVRRAVGIALVFGIALPLLVLGVVAATSSVPAAPREVPLPAAAPAKPLPAAANEYSPMLMFDKGERFRTPLDIDRMLATGKVDLCPEGRGLLADCRKINRARDLRNGFGNLRFNTQEIENADLPTTIYAHTMPDQLNPRWTDIDYWWYLPDNPANTAQGAMCGAGFVIPEITCFDHQSDWEGATVVVNADQKPVAVHFAAHDHVVNVPWDLLGADKHPRVFVARGTHAGYPLPCRSSSCATGTVLQDNRHGGEHVWPEEACSPQGCVTPFPRQADGVHGASWNGFDGRWGSAVCIAEDLYCARSGAPLAPGNQKRYKRPWCYDFTVTRDLSHPRASKPSGC